MYLQSLSLLFTHTHLDALLPAALDFTLELTGADRALLLLRQSTGISLAASRNCQGSNLPEPEAAELSKLLAGMFEGNKSLFVQCAEDEPALPETHPGPTLKSTMWFPLWRLEPAARGKDPLGLLYLDSESEIVSLKNEDLQLLIILLRYLSVSLAHAALFDELESKNQEVTRLNKELQRRVAQQADSLHEMELLLVEKERELGRVHGLGNIIGRSENMLEVFRILERVVHTEASLLITGESGTGKEMIARYIHRNGPRCERPMISINCSAFNDTLLESELFGHRKGSFTGAHEDKTGLFQLADGSTLFLDEVAEMSQDMQKRLLRVLENGEVRPIGSKKASHVDVRIIAATNKDLEQHTGKGKFREDLFFRLNVLHIHIPPLRQRREDIPLLIDHFSRKIAKEMKVAVRKIPSDILRSFALCDWPGNIRQLANEVRRFYILGSKYRSEKMVGSFQPKQREVEDVALEVAERKAILRALEMCSGNKTKAASLVGISRRGMYYKLKKYNLTRSSK